ncbi:hypothetical protein [Paenibacillus albus]|uniref:Swt1-like HEPN domain-containing protein n=1 Tax=Paenibacillus albus TaxID=2495582 RepID=A0A3S9A198_9BACL|nr:hypothetical protein [Paenibacillus albus]AZN39543.1 hypothetical protein EJC50_07610 [Paenibacillus albus]
MKIPIIPVSELNQLSDEAIENAENSTLLLLREELEIYKAKYEAVVAEKNQLWEFMANRVDKIDTKLSVIIEKIDNIIDMINTLQNEIKVIRSLSLPEEQILDFIEKKIDSVIANIEKKNFDLYIEITKAWLNDDWNKLEALSSDVFLPSAEFLFDKVRNIENADPAPFIIQYCRALENELLKKIFIAYLKHLKEERIDCYSVFSWDLETNGIGIPQSKNKNSYQFAKKIAELLKKDESLWFFELGNMSVTLEYITGTSVEKSPILSHFRDFILKYFDVNFIDKEFFNNLKAISKDYRNKAAHPNSLNSTSALIGRETIRSQIKSLLSHYKFKTKE